jgi:CRP-like cAMP-binding protein
MRHVTHDVLNKILEHLAPPLRDHVIGQCNYVDFPNGQTIYSEGSTAQYVYFIECGLVALVKRTHGGKSIESGLIGNEGFGWIRWSNSGGRLCGASGKEGGRGSSDCKCHRRLRAPGEYIRSALGCTKCVAGRIARIIVGANPGEGQRAGS